MRDPGFEKVYALFTKGAQWNEQIDLYDEVKNNENFYIGKQWEGVQANGNPTPVFNVLKRVASYQVAKITADNFAIACSPMAMSQKYNKREIEQICDVCNKQFATLIERNKLATMMRKFVRNAAIDGDGATYSYWDPDIETGQEARGDIVTELIENTRVLFGNPNVNEVQRQPWIIITTRQQADQAKRTAKKNGQDPDVIMPDQGINESNYDALSDDRVTVLVYFARDPETKHIWSGKYTQGGVVEPFRDIGLKKYPITWMNWDFVQDCYHGHALISQLIPNQVFINQMFALVMRSQMTTAFPKPIYDKTRISHWDTGVGKAIGVNGGDINSVAKILDPAPISPQVAQFIGMAIDYTQSLMGASDAALGDTRPDNTSAIIALQRASDAPLEIPKQNTYQAIEDLAVIYLDFMREYYGQRYTDVKFLSGDEQNNQPLGMAIPEQNFNTLFDFSMLNDVPMSLKIDVGPSSFWSEITTVQTLDNLLRLNVISLDEYLERMPDNYISKKQDLIDKRRGIGQAGAPTPPGGSQIVDTTGPEPPVQGGPGYGQLQRALNNPGAA